jgi:alpha-N-arabinofuranosidase
LNNAILIPMPGGAPYMMPVARVMSLYRQHVGQWAIDLASVPEGLDAVGSRSGDRLFLHVVNTELTQTIAAALRVDGVQIESGKVFQIAGDPVREIDPQTDGEFAPMEHDLPADGTWRFPPASVTAIELQVCSSVAGQA